MLKVKPLATLVWLSTISAVFLLPVRVLAETEKLSFSFSNNLNKPSWHLGYENEVKGQYSIAEFIREGDNIENWKEILTIQNFAKSFLKIRSPEDICINP